MHSSTVAPAALKERVHEGRTGSGIGVIQARVDGSKGPAVLGVQYHSIQQVVDGEIVAFEDYAQRGWTGVPGEKVLALH